MKSFSKATHQCAGHSSLEASIEICNSNQARALFQLNLDHKETLQQKETSNQSKQNCSIVQELASLCPAFVFTCKPTWKEANSIAKELKKSPSQSHCPARPFHAAGMTWQDVMFVQSGAAASSGKDEHFELQVMEAWSSTPTNQEFREQENENRVGFSLRRPFDTFKCGCAFCLCLSFVQEALYASYIRLHDRGVK